MASLIINSPWYCPQAHKTLLDIMPHYNGVLDKIIFMGGATPLATLSPSQTLQTYLLANNQKSELSNDDFALLDKCALHYRSWAQKQGITLLVCGMAAKRFLLDNKISSCDGLALTGYMELLALLNKKGDALIW